MFLSFPGFDRNIPGFPRYSMFGDERDGVHNLRIEDIRSEDEGEFQCQVSHLLFFCRALSENFVQLFIRPTTFMATFAFVDTSASRFFPSPCERLLTTFSFHSFAHATFCDASLAIVNY